MAFEFVWKRLCKGDAGFELWGPEQIGVCKVFDLLVPAKLIDKGGNLGKMADYARHPTVEFEGRTFISGNWAKWYNQNLIRILSELNTDMWRKYPI